MATASPSCPPSPAVAEGPVAPSRSVGRLSGRRLLAGLLVALGALLFAHVGALDNVFHYDDIHSVVQNLHLRSLADPSSFLTDPTTFSARPERAMFRPLVVLSYAVTYALAGLQPSAHLLVNLLTDGLCAGIVLVLARSLWLPAIAAGTASLLFALHPVNGEVVNYVSSRSESFAAAGMLAALWTYLRWRDGAGSAVFYGLSLAAFCMALLSKATAIALPGMLLAAEGLRAQRRRPVNVLPFLGLGLAYLWVVANLAQQALAAPVRPLLHQVWTQLKAVPYYLHLLAVPARLSVEHDFSVAPTLLAPVVVLSAVLLLTTVFVVWQQGGFQLRFLGVCVALGLAPASLVPLNVLVNEHRLYLVSACLAIAAGASLWPRLRRLWGARAGVLILLAILAVLSQQRGRVWDSEQALWSEAAERSPYAYRAHLHLGGALEEQGDIVGALDSYREAARLAPGRAETHYNLGNALRLTGHPLQARRSWERSLQQNPRFLDALLNLAAHHQGLGDWDQVWDLLARAEQVRPRSPEVWRRKGLALRLTDDVAGAESAYLRALELDPRLAEAHHNLANLYNPANGHFKGRGDEAQRHYQIALQQNAGHHGAANNLADLLLNAGDPVAAERICREVIGLAALRHTPGQTKLYLQLGRALEAQGRTAEALGNYRVFVRSRAAPAALRQAVQQRIEQLETPRR